MAKLVPPTKAIRGRKFPGGPWSKFHLMNANTDNPDPLSVCGKIITVIEKLPDMVETQDIGKISASDLCRKCLGAMTAED